MGLRDRVERAKQAAAAAVRDDERVSNAAEKARNMADELSQHEAVRDLDLAAVREAAVDSSGLTNRHGKMGKARMARAAINPMGTAASVGKGVGKEILRQRRTTADAPIHADPSTAIEAPE